MPKYNHNNLIALYHPKLFHFCLKEIALYQMVWNSDIAKYFIVHQN